ncbi:MAG: hypothetical protein WAU75_25305, partial [Solirubrobacteraceae bacterium]
AGIFGGQPGAMVNQRMGRRVLSPGAYPQRGRPDDPAELGGSWVTFGPKPGMMPMAAGDVFAVSWQGGGGVGDPLDRDPELVWRDVRDGVISTEHARDVYGVIGSGGIDAMATSAHRLDVRRRRLGGREPQEAVAAGPADAGLPLGPSLRLHNADGTWEVRSAGHLLVRGTTAWRSAARSVAIDDPELHPGLALTAWYCPFTGRQLAVDVHERDAPPTDDIAIDLEGLVAPIADHRDVEEMTVDAV